MDILSHGLWAHIAAKGINRLRPALPLKMGWAVFWGVFPDFFAFTIPFVILFYRIIFGPLEWADWPRPVEEPAPGDALSIFRGTEILYSLSHSLVVFFVIFLGIWLMRKKPVWELGAWFLHILLDIPTHTYKFYPTPLFWPFFNWKFNGFLWSEPWFLILNYTAIIIVYWLLRKRDSRPKPHQTISNRQNDIHRSG